MPPSSIRLALVSHQPILLVGLKTLLARDRSFSVVGEALSNGEALDMAVKIAPDVLLIDHHPPQMNGVELLRKLNLKKSAARAILLATDMPEPHNRAALVHGAWGVVQRASAIDVLPGCIKHVMTGERWIGVDTVNALMGTLRAPSITPAMLSPRELQLVNGITTGASNKEIASKLHMSEQTVKNYLRRLYKKLQVSSRVELAMLAMEPKFKRSKPAKTKLPSS